MITLPTAQQTAARLQRSAAAHARSAVIHVTSDDDQVRGAIDAGVAVEHMAKAMLATLHPALLADRSGDLDTMLHLTGLGNLAKCAPHEIKTIGAHEACLRVARLMPAFNYHQQADKALFDARNGGAHFALTTDGVARESARIMVRLLEPLIKVLKIERDAFWGDMASVADTLLDETINQVAAALEMKLAAARSRLQTRLAGLGANEQELVLKALTARLFYAEEEEPYDCPVCDQPGIVTCELHDSGEPDFDYDETDEGGFIFISGYVEQSAYGMSFSCEACGLRLDYDEMEAADMETVYTRDARECEQWEFDPNLY